MNALTISAPGHASYGLHEDPSVSGSDVLVRVEACGICGTDVHIYRGEYMGSYPIIPGHEFAGIVEATGPDVTDLALGTRVAIEPNISCDRCYNCLNNRQNFCENWTAIGVTLPGAMAELVAVPRKAVFQVGDLTAQQAAFVEPLSCVLHGVRKISITPGDRVAVLGAGPIGLLLMRVLAASGASVVDVAERSESRAARAREAGADQVILDLGDVPESRYDIVVDATGSPAALQQAVRIVRPGGQILMFGVSARGATVSLEPYELFAKGLTITSSFTSVRNTYQALQLLQSGVVRVDDLVSHRLSLAEFERAIEIIESVSDDVLKIQLLPMK